MIRHELFAHFWQVPKYAKHNGICHYIHHEPHEHWACACNSFGNCDWLFILVKHISSSGLTSQNAFRRDLTTNLKMWLHLLFIRTPTKLLGLFLRSLVKQHSTAFFRFCVGNICENRQRPSARAIVKLQQKLTKIKISLQKLTSNYVKHDFWYVFNSVFNWICVSWVRHFLDLPLKCMRIASIPGVTSDSSKIWSKSDPDAKKNLLNKRPAAAGGRSIRCILLAEPFSSNAPNKFMNCTKFRNVQKVKINKSRHTI